jgi:hypothetical protein
MHTNTVSHLAASEPPGSVVPQPSAAIFDGTMLVAGALIVAGAWFAWRALRRKAVLIPTVLTGHVERPVHRMSGRASIFGIGP